MDNRKLLRSYILFPIFSLFILIFFLVAVEAGFQLVGYLKAGKNTNINYPSFCCGFKLLKNYDKTYWIDGKGFRWTPYDYNKLPSKDVYKIVTMGDSITFGGPNAEYLNYPAYLEFVLNSSPVKSQIPLPGGKQFIDVINAGIPAYTSHYVKYYLKDTILALDPDMVIISVGTNDQAHALNNPVLWFFEKNVPVFYWYYNMSATVAYFRKFLSPITSKLKEYEPEKQNNEDRELGNSSGKAPGYLEYEKNIREMVKILKERGIVPVLMPWPFTPGTSDVKKFSFGEEEIMNERSFLQYKVYSAIMEKVAKEFKITLVNTPFQLPLIPKKHGSKYFMASYVHLNNYGAKIVGLALADAIKGIVEGKTSDEIYSESFTALHDGDLLDYYSYIMMSIEPHGSLEIQNTISVGVKGIADDCMKNTSEDMSVPGYHFTECFFSIPDAAIYSIRLKKYDLAKWYLDYAVNRYPKLAYPYFVYGLLNADLGNYKEAKLFFEKAIQADPFFKAPLFFMNKLPDFAP